MYSTAPVATSGYGAPWNWVRQGHFHQAPAVSQVPVVVHQAAPPPVAVAAYDDGYHQHKKTKWRGRCIIVSLVLILLLLAALGVGIWAILEFVVSPGANCGMSPCKNDGLCREVLNGDEQFECVCPPGYEGTHCESAVNLCVGEPCAGRMHSLCVPTAGSYRCDCIAGYTKDVNGFCSDVMSCASNPCASITNSVCVEASGTYRCDCQVGYQPDGMGNCDVSNPCNPSPCGANFQCAITGTGTTFACNCFAGYVDDGSGNCVIDNYAATGTASQSCESANPLHTAANAIDGSMGTTDPTCTHTCSEATPWWKVEMPNEVLVATIEVRNEDTDAERFDQIEIRVGNNNVDHKLNALCKSFQGYIAPGAAYTIICDTPVAGTVVSIQRIAQLTEVDAPLNFCEVKIFA